MKNREIKFRVWDKNEKRFLLDGEYVIDAQGGLYFLGRASGKIFISQETFTNDVLIMESTGLKDVHGAELFEGDLCKYEGEDDKSFFGFVIDFFWGSFRLGGDCIDNFIESELAAATGFTSLQKIGNALENPELIQS
jgi:uncharacterized phage protein (TIGR01671 family)